MVRKEGDHTTVLFLSKVRLMFIAEFLNRLGIVSFQVKLMGWESSDQMPAILRQSDVEVVLGNAEVKKLLSKSAEIISTLSFQRWFCEAGRDWKILKTFTDQT